MGARACEATCPGTARDRDPQGAVRHTLIGEKLEYAALDERARNLDAQLFCSVCKPVEMGSKIGRVSVEDGDRLEEAVAENETAIGWIEWDLSLDEPAIEPTVRHHMRSTKFRNRS